MKVEVWSDVVCPWCYVGKRHLEEALARFRHGDQVSVEWRSFELTRPLRPGWDSP
ncbi:MAG TPA: DsbA family protein [Acidimicrobiales bacterium]|nr:DsbA family protein [Acidimicrobiales bacterium]